MDASIAEPPSPSRITDGPVDSAAIAKRIAWFFVILGISLRLLRYLLRFPLWGDECMLAENLITHTPTELLSPLDNGQVAPVGFTEALWVMTRLFGFNEWSLRFLSFLGGMGGLIVIYRFAFRLLPPLPALFTVALLAISYYPIRHSAEVKPYAFDLAWSVILLALSERWIATDGKSWFTSLLFLTPLALLTSFTATFVAGGICIGLGIQSLLRRSTSQLLLAGLYGLILSLSFIGIYYFLANGQFTSHGSKMQNYWKASFPPPLTHPLDWITWMIGTHAGEMFAYPFGGNFGGSTLTTLLCLLGLIWLWRNQQFWFLGACFGTFGLGYIAASLQRYPYGDTARLVQHLAPFICLLAAAGITWLIELPQTLARRNSFTRLILSMFLLIGIVFAIRDVIVPYKLKYDYVHRGMARWFWDPKRDPTDLYCVRSDFGHDFWPGTWHSIYLCYQHIESPGHPLDKPRIRVPDLPADHPANVVVYHEPGNEQKGELWDQWWLEMTARFDHVGTDDHRVLVDRVGRSTIYGIYRVYRFVPKSPKP